MHHLPRHFLLFISVSLVAVVFTLPAAASVPAQLKQPPGQLTTAKRFSGSTEGRNVWFPHHPMLTSTWLVALFHLSLFARLRMILSHPFCTGLGAALAGVGRLASLASYNPPPQNNKSATRPGQDL